MKIRRHIQKKSCLCIQECGVRLAKLRLYVVSEYSTVQYRMVRAVDSDTTPYILLRRSPVAARLAVGCSVPKQPKQRMSSLSFCVTGNYTLTVT